MKRTYITPATETVNVAAQQMLVSSPGSGIEFDGSGFGSGSLNSGYEDGVLSKDFDFDLW